MSDVAAAAGVSTATVSRTLAGSRRVQGATRERVLTAAKELSYTPNNLPGNLRSRSTRIIGLVITDIGNPFFTSVFRGCEEAAQRLGYSLVLSNTDEDGTKESAALTTMTAERAAGVILASTGRSGESLQKLLSLRIPVVALDRRIEGAALDTVVVDNESASSLAVRHFVELGHRRIGYVGGPVALSVFRDRCQGYRHGLAAAYIEHDHRLVRQGDLRETGGYRMAMELLRQPDPPTAVFAANNLTTLGLLRAVRELGLRIPQDISVLGFDDLPNVELIDPPMTVLAQPTFQLGVRAVELIARRLEDPGAPIQEFVLNPTLIVRGSTGPWADSPRTADHR